MTAVISITIGSIPGLVSFSRSYILFRPIRWSTRIVNVGPRSVDTIKLNFSPVRFGNHRCQATSKACDPVVKPLRLGGAKQSARIVGAISLPTEQMRYEPFWLFENHPAAVERDLLR